MTDKNEFGRLLAANLKALNAKERDHLMRFAYLGEDGAYKESERFLSQPFLLSLRNELGETISQLEEKDRLEEGCLFAGMDYHIDWLHAALFMTAKGATIGGDHTFEPQKRGEDPEDPDLRPVLGNQEDVDLLVLLNARGMEQGGTGKFHLVFIEAKGMDSFDPVQLGRKLVRVNRSIRKASETAELADWLDFTYLLLSASDPDIGGYVEYVAKKNGGRKIGENEKDPLPGIVEQLPTRDELKFNPDAKWLEMRNYPEILWRVQRCDKCGKAKAGGEYWRLDGRKARGSDESKGE